MVSGFRQDDRILEKGSGSPEKEEPKRKNQKGRIKKEESKRGWKNL